MATKVETDISAEALEALHLARQRSGSEEKFLENLSKLQKAINERQARVVGNLCVLGVGYSYASNKEELAKILKRNPDRFVAVLIDKEVQTLSPDSSVRYSALIDSNVHDSAVVTNSVLVESAVWGTARVDNSWLYMTILRAGTISEATVRGVEQVLG